MTHYTTLGVAPTATQDEIKRAYRKLASQHHPDKGGDKDKFQEIQAAYDTLSDPSRRAEYDRPGMRININQGGMPPGFDFDSIFSMFGARMHQAQGQRQERVTIWITLEDAVRGGGRLVSLGTPTGNATVEIHIPPGIDDGDNVRYPSLSPSGGDLIVQFRLQPNQRWRREGVNLWTEVSVDFWDLIMGAEIEIDHLLGSKLSLTIPARTNPGQVLRARGRGVARDGQATGDLMVRLSAVVPKDIPDELIEILTKIQANK